MTLYVSYIADETIERDAEALIAEYAQARGSEVRAPIPIEDIVEKHLKLRFDFDDLHRLLGVPHSGLNFGPDIFGAIWLEDGQIVIDESLDPEVRSEREARFRFTLAHEAGGHWRLHRPFVLPTHRQVSLSAGTTRPTIVCRSSQAKARVEWQADFHASCVLMPRKLILSAWHEAFPDCRPRVLQQATPIEHPFAAIARNLQDSEDQALREFARPFAEQFRVSPIAMQIRLERLGLLHRVVPRQQLLSEG